MKTLIFLQRHWPVEAVVYREPAICGVDLDALKKGRERAHMILKILLLPFRLDWMIYLVFALSVGYLANQEYQTYLSNTLAAEFQVAGGPANPSPLSKWNARSDVSANDEANVEGVYFAALD